MNDVQLMIKPDSEASKAALQAIAEKQGGAEKAQAEQMAKQLINQFPKCLASLYLNYQIAVANRKVTEAEYYLKLAINLQPQHPVFCLNLAQLLLQQYQYAAAVNCANQAAEYYVGSNVTFLNAVAKVLKQAEQPMAALVVYQRLLALSPDNIEFMHQLALCYFFLNKPKDAAKLLNKVIAATDNNAIAVHLRSALQTYTKKRNNIAQITELLATAKGRHPANFYALAKELEDIGEYNESFKYLMQGARLMRQALNYNEAAELASIRGIIAATKNITFEQPVGKTKPGPIFIVGMPRTGTTLVERILAQHKGVKSIGEFSLFPQLIAVMANEYLESNQASVNSLHEAVLHIDFAELGRRYRAAATQAANGNTCFIDKLPVNFLYCGFIKKALPEAKIIHLCRNPMDSCYAIFKTLFVNAYSFSYNFDELANYYATYQQVMAHWHKVMPGQILDVNYEDVVTDAEAQAKRLTQWCGLTYSADMLDFYQADAASTTASAAQVRKPIYASSIEKWRNIEAELAPLKLKLQQAGVVV